MTTKTRPKVTTTTEEYFICDICKEEIPSSKHNTCVMCHRDVHPSVRATCSVYDREQEGTVCNVCWKLGEDHRAVVERCNEETDAAFTEWQNVCDEHRYDEIGTSAGKS